jgi:hypothetical protein
MRRFCFGHHAVGVLDRVAAIQGHAAHPGDGAHAGAAAERPRLVAIPPSVPGKGQTAHPRLLAQRQGSAPGRAGGTTAWISALARKAGGSALDPFLAVSFLFELVS